MTKCKGKEKGTKTVNREEEKPFLFRNRRQLRGARQVGKTTLVDSLGKLFDTYLHLNLENEDAAELFEKKVNTEDLMAAIFLYCNKTRIEGRTLLFIDEIQNSPKAVAKLRYFYEELPDTD